MVTWDDHEVSNNYAGSTNEIGLQTGDFLQLRAAAYQAWYEHMPVRLDPPNGPDLAIHRRFAWGDLADVFVLASKREGLRALAGLGLLGDGLLVVVAARCGRAWADWEAKRFVGVWCRGAGLKLGR